MKNDAERNANARQRAKSERISAENDNAAQTTRGEVRQGALGRTLGSATKNNRHGLATDRSTSRRTESRRQGYMGSESKNKSARKNV